MSGSNEEGLFLPLALSCKRRGRRWWMHKINEKREHLGKCHCLCVELQSHENRFFKYFRMSRVCLEEIHDLLRPARFHLIFSADSSTIPYCLPGKSVSKTQMSVARHNLHWSAVSARLLFYGDDAVLHNTVRTPSRHGHRSLPAVAARFLCGRTFSSRLCFVENAFTSTF